MAAKALRTVFKVDSTGSTGKKTAGDLEGAFRTGRLARGASAQSDRQNVDAR
jgi:hypothetical protein